MHKYLELASTVKQQAFPVRKEAPLLASLAAYRMFTNGPFIPDHRAIDLSWTTFDNYLPSGRARCTAIMNWSRI
jgi:hypothetical protein